jgi:amino acid transporter
VLEFVALVFLRIREPELRRPFRVPGGMAGAVGVGICPLLLLGFAMFHGEREQILGVSALAFGATLIAGGVVVYGAMKAVARRNGWVAAATQQKAA